MNDAAYTLHIDQIERSRDKHGHFIKRCIPWNKGLSWDEQGMPKEEQERRRRSFMEGAKRAVRPHKSYNGHPVIQMDEQGNRIHWYASSEMAAKKLGLHGRLIRKVCDGERHHTGGFRWKWDERFLT
jgi:hypothetical protein